MARSWLTSSLLLSKYWYYPIKYALQVTNYLPIKFRGQISTPFEIVYHTKPDIQTFLPMFSIVYVDKHNNNVAHRSNMTTQSIQFMVIFTSSKENCIEFYHLPSTQILTCAIYKLDPTLVAGPISNRHYDGGLFFNTYHNEADIHRLTTFSLNPIVYSKYLSSHLIHISSIVIGVHL